MHPFWLASWVHTHIEYLLQSQILMFRTFKCCPWVNSTLHLAYMKSKHASRRPCYCGSKSMVDFLNGLLFYSKDMQNKLVSHECNVTTLFPSRPVMELKGRGNYWLSVVPLIIVGYCFWCYYTVCEVCIDHHSVIMGWLYGFSLLIITFHPWICIVYQPLVVWILSSLDIGLPTHNHAHFSAIYVCLNFLRCQTFTICFTW